MSRQLKFRAWDSEKKIWFYFDLSQNPEYWSEKINDCPLQQFIGIKDKNSSYIYEGDIVEMKCPDPLCSGKHLGEIVWRESYCGFVFRDYKREEENPIIMVSELGFTAPLIIRGNIYENPGLLELE